MLLQEVANSWKYGTTALEFIGGRIHVKFISPIGVPDDIQALKDVLEDTKPAHLAIFYTFLWLTWGQAKDYGSWRQHKDNGSWLDVKRLRRANMSDFQGLPKTTNLNLNKPGYDNVADIMALNENADIIDAAIKTNIDDIANIKKDMSKLLMALVLIARAMSTSRNIHILPAV